MAELATAPANRHKLTPGVVGGDARRWSTRWSRSSTPLAERFDPPTEFVVPGETRWPRCSTWPHRRAPGRAARRSWPPRRRRSSSPTSTASPTCCGRWPAGRRAHSLSAASHATVGAPCPSRSRPPSRARAAPMSSASRSTPTARYPGGSLSSRQLAAARLRRGRVGHSRPRCPVRCTSVSASRRGHPGGAADRGRRAWPAPRPAAAVVATSLADVDGIDGALAAQAVAEGVVLGSYRYLAVEERRVRRRRSSASC